MTVQDEDNEEDEDEDEEGEEGYNSWNCYYSCDEIRTNCGSMSGDWNPNKTCATSKKNAKGAAKMFCSAPCGFRVRGGGPVWCKAQYQCSDWSEKTTLSRDA